MNFSIGKKLFLGFGVLLFCILAYGAFVLFELGIIGSNNSEYVKRSADEIKITLASRLGPYLYETIAGGIINGGDPRRSAAWETAKTSALAEMAEVAALADTQVEKDWVAAASKDLDDIVNLYEDRLTPALAAGARADEIVRLDSEMTGLVGAMDSSLDKLKNSLSSENRVAETAMIKAISATKTASLLVSLLLLLVGMTVAVILTRLITRPLGVAVDLALAIAEGDLTRGLDESYTRAKDETGALAGALNKMAARMREAVVAIQGISGQVAEGSASLNLSVQQLSQGTAGLSTSAMQLSQGSSEQASSGEELSSSIEEMAANVRQNSDNAMQTEQIASKAAGDAKSGGTAVSETVEAMRLICSKIGVIEEIARNTNLLALNAAIEAARAGDAGKGFAVVASEVRKLAERSQTAAGEIGTMATKSVATAEKAGSLIAGVLTTVERTADLVQEITAASREQHTGTEQINKAILQLDAVIQQNASLSEELSSVSEEISAQAEEIAATSTDLKEKARGLEEAVAYFKTGDEGNRADRRTRDSLSRSDRNGVSHMSRQGAKPARRTLGIAGGATAAKGGTREGKPTNEDHGLALPQVGIAVKRQGDDRDEQFQDY